MPSTYSPNLNLELQATGENDGTWGVKVNADLSQIDLSMGGRLSLSVAGSTDVTLTDAQAQNLRHTYTGALTGNISVIVPNTGRFYIITNSTTGSYTLTVKPSGGTGIAIPQGSTMYLFSNPSTAAMENPVGYLSSLTLASLTTTSLTVNGTAAATTGIALLGAASASAARSTLGLGTAATQNTGTSGANVPLLNGNNTYSGTSAFSGIVTMSAAVNDNKGANIASATTTDIGAATGNYVVVTGTTTITGFGTVQAGTVRIVEFSGAGTLTHNATSLILPGGANITRAAGDVGVFVSEGSGNWRCVSYTKATGQPIVSGAILQMVEATPYATYSTLTTVLPADDTIPQNTEGTQLATVSITPLSASSKIVVYAEVPMLVNSDGLYGVLALFKDSTAAAIAATYGVRGVTANDDPRTVPLSYEEASGSTTARTYKLRAGPGAAGNLYINGNSSTRLFGGVMAARMRVIEIG